MMGKKMNVQSRRPIFETTCGALVQHVECIACLSPPYIHLLLLAQVKAYHIEYTPLQLAVLNLV